MLRCGYIARLQNTRAMSSNMRWLWPADRESRAYHIAHPYGTRIAVFGVGIKSSKLLKESDVSLALQHLVRKTPNLRVNLQQRGDTLWFYEPDNPAIEIQIQNEGASIEEEINCFCENGFSNSRTVPWKVKLIQRESSIPESESKTTQKYPHEYDLIFTGHHAFAGGVSASINFNNFIDLLNDVLNGRNIDAEQCGQFTKREEIWKLETIIIESLKKDTARLKKVQQSLPDASVPLTILQAFPRPSNVLPSTGHVNQILEPYITKCFTKKCKKHGVSFNSAITAVVNVALVKLMQESGLSQESYRIVSSHAVNISRYLKHTPMTDLGGYALQYSYISEVGRSVHQNFWEYCRMMNKELKAAFASELPLEQKLCRLMQDPDVNNEERLINPPPVVYDFSITNLGNIPVKDPAEDDHIFIYHMGAFNLIQRYVHMNLHQIFTFKGQLSYTISYATDYMSEETASLFLGKVMSVLQEVSQFHKL